MSNVEDLRKAVQDFITPDLKALAAKLEALEKETRLRFEHAERETKAHFEHAENENKARFEHLDKLMKASFDHVYARPDYVEKSSVERSAAAEKLAASRHDTYMANHSSVMNAIDTERRLSRLESERNKPDPPHA